MLYHTNLRTESGLQRHLRRSGERGSGSKEGGGDKELHGQFQVLAMLCVVLVHHLQRTHSHPLIFSEQDLY